MCCDFAHVLCRGPTSASLLRGELVYSTPPQPRSRAATPEQHGLDLRRGYLSDHGRPRTSGSAPAGPTVLGSGGVSVGGWEPTGPAGCRPFDIGLEHRGRHPWVGGLDPVCAEGWPQSRLGGVEGGRGLRSVWGCVQGSAVCSTEAAAVAALSPRPRGQLRLWVACLPVPPALSPGSLRSALSSASLFLRVRLEGSRFGKHDGFLISFCLIILANTSSIFLKKVVRADILALFLVLEENTQSLTIKCDFSCRCYVDALS